MATSLIVLRSAAKFGLLLVLCLPVTYCQNTGTATTTRYWDCCKPTCAWTGNAGKVSAPVRSCSAAGVTTLDDNTESGCVGGSAYVCNDLQPFVKNGKGYAFAAASVVGLAAKSLCCVCYNLAFTAAPLKGKTLTVQVINTGTVVDRNTFDIHIPGGGIGSYTQGCRKQWPSTSSSAWGAQYGGVSSRAQCASLPSALVSGCQWRFDWFQGADNPPVTFTRVTCPAALTNISNCSRSD